MAEKDNKNALKLLVILVLATLTVHAVFWTFNAFDPAKPQYRDLELQFGLQLMHMLLFFWMLIAVLSIFWDTFAKRKK